MSFYTTYLIMNSVPVPLNCSVRAFIKHLFVVIECFFLLVRDSTSKSNALSDHFLILIMKELTTFRKLDISCHCCWLVSQAQCLFIFCLVSCHVNALDRPEREMGLLKFGACHVTFLTFLDCLPFVIN